MIAGPGWNGAGGGRAQGKRIATGRRNANPGDLGVIDPCARMVVHTQQKQGRRCRKHGNQQADEGRPDLVGVSEQQPGKCNKGESGNGEKDEAHPLSQPFF